MAPIVRVFTRARRIGLQRWGSQVAKVADGVFLNAPGRTIGVTLWRSALRAVAHRQEKAHVAEVQPDAAKAIDNVERSAVWRRGLRAATEGIPGFPWRRCVSLSRVLFVEA